MPWNFSASNKTSGFGMIELLISISIMAVVSSIILARQTGFNSAVLLRNQAYEIALEMREIQLNAVSASGDANVGNFRSILGLQFNSSDGTNGTYEIFRDADSDGFYDSGEEFGSQGVLDNRFEIREIRAGSDTLDQVSIVFARPNFDARFFTGPGNELNEPVVELDVALRGVDGDGPSALRTIEVTATGQIGVQ